MKKGLRLVMGSRYGIPMKERRPHEKGITTFRSAKSFLA